MKSKILSISLLFILTTHSVLADCYEKIKLIDGNQTVKTDVWGCQDGTISFSQPDMGGEGKEGKKNNYNGKCGPTAAANIFHAYCNNLFVDPKEIADKYFDDITPGVRPDTLEYGLNQLFLNNNECTQGKWTYFYAQYGLDFISKLNKHLYKDNSDWIRTNSKGIKQNISPVIVLLNKKDDKKILHYVTVVGIEGFDIKNQDSYDTCQVIYNDMGGQHKSKCFDFADYARRVDDSILTSYLPEYIYFAFKKDEESKLGKSLSKTVERKIAPLFKIN